MRKNVLLSLFCLGAFMPSAYTALKDSRLFVDTMMAPHKPAPCVSQSTSVTADEQAVDTLFCYFKQKDKDAVTLRGFLSSWNHMVHVYNETSGSFQQIMHLFDKIAGDNALIDREEFAPLGRALLKLGVTAEKLRQDCPRFTSPVNVGCSDSIPL